MSQFRRQLLFLCDAFLFAVAVAGYKFITVLLPYTEVGAKGSFPKNVLLLYGCTVIAQLLCKTYDSLWRYAESREYLALLCAAICGFGAYEIFSRALLHESISFVLLAAIASLWVLEMLAVRFGYRMYRTFSIQREQPGAVPVAIIGAGSAGVQLLDELQHNPNSRYHVQCFFDDDPAKVNKRIRGVPVSGLISQALPRMRAMDIHEAIFAIPSMDELHRKEILRQLADRSIRVSTLPSTLELIDQKPIRQQLPGGADRGSAGPGGHPAGHHRYGRPAFRAYRAGDGGRRVHRLGAVPPDRQAPPQAAGDLRHLREQRL